MNSEKLEETLTILKEMNLEYISDEGSCKIIIKDKYGYCSISLNNLRKRSYPTIQSSIDKSSYFINRAKEVHGEKFDYSPTNYISSNSKVCIICPIHGKIYLTPMCHLRGDNCYKCAGRSLSDEEKIEKFRLVHGDKYQYILPLPKRSKDLMRVICKDHRRI